jgi:hypothetical protein
VVGGLWDWPFVKQDVVRIGQQATTITFDVAVIWKKPVGEERPSPTTHPLFAHTSQRRTSDT